jgi:hypothetical protein
VIDREPPYLEEAGASSTGSACYRAYTVLPVEWAYRNARLITRPESYWLDPNSRRTTDGTGFNDDGQGAWRPAGGNNLCPVCGAAGGCVLKSDNRTALCRSIRSSTEIRTSRGLQFWSHTSLWAQASSPEPADQTDGSSNGVAP